MAQRQWRSDDTDAWLYGFGNGSDGDLTISADTTEAPIDSSCSGTTGTTSLSATNASFAAGQLILIHQTRGTGAGGWELNKIASYTAGTITTTHNLTMTYIDSGASQAQVRVMKQYNNVTIDSTKTYTAKAWDGDLGGIIGWFAKTATNVNGTISAKGKGFRGGAKGATNSRGTQGESSTGIGSVSASANGSGGGGGDGTANGGSYWAASGGGAGHASTGSNGTDNLADGGASPGLGGSTDGTASAVDMNLGAGGGGAGDRSNYTGASSPGSPGGGISVIFSKTITIDNSTGSIDVSASNAAAASGGPSGGGGGSGGTSLEKFETASLGTNRILSSAGTGGDGNNIGGNGSVGRNHADYSISYTGTTSPTLDATNDATIISATETYSVTKSLAYAVLNPHSVTKSAQYAVKRPISITKSAQYAIYRTIAAITKGLEYVVAPQNVVLRSMQYAILTMAGIQKDMAYKIISDVAITKQLAYAVLTNTELQKGMIYGILSIHSLTKAMQYVIYSTRQITKGMTYEIGRDGYIYQYSPRGTVYERYEYDK